MRALTGLDILRIWEVAQSQRPIDRALAMLCCALPDRSAAELAALPVGQRDTLLFKLREQLIGPVLRSTTQCPGCGAKIDSVAPGFSFQTHASSGSAAPRELLFRDYRVEFRLPDSRDVAAMGSCANQKAAVRVLLSRCVIAAERGGSPLASANLPEEVIAELAAVMAELDPQGEILLSLHCPGCGHEWNGILEIAAFFFIELSGLVRRLVREVHTIAQAYGWREPEILAMSSQHRQLYLELVGA